MCSLDKKPVVIPHDKDEEVKNSDANPDDTKNVAPDRRKILRQPDGTEVERLINEGGKVLDDTL